MGSDAGVSDLANKRWDRHCRIIAWRYDVKRTVNIIMGTDPLTNDDIHKWRGLGHK